MIHQARRCSSLKGCLLRVAAVATYVRVPEFTRLWVGSSLLALDPRPRTPFFLCSSLLFCIVVLLRVRVLSDRQARRKHRERRLGEAVQVLIRGR